MNDKIIKPFSKRSKSFHNLNFFKASTPSHKRDLLDFKDISLEFISRASSNKRIHNYNNIKKKSSNKSQFHNKKRKKVSFKIDLIDIVPIENWKIYNNPNEEKVNDNKGKDRTICACVLC